MGYLLRIGEAVIDAVDQECPPCITVGQLSVEGTPAHTDCGNPSEDRSNCILPGYNGWSDFASRRNLRVLFWGGAQASCPDGGPWTGPDGGRYAPLMPSHPGAGRLYPAHLAAFRQARELVPATRHHGAFLQRTDILQLDWLIWWTDWALKNCKCPVLANS